MAAAGRPDPAGALDAGPFDADIAFVGEAPGATEVEAGAPMLERDLRVVREIAAGE
jgi:uracil-DNA glycosylase